MAFARKGVEDAADREEKKNREIDEAAGHGDAEEENLPVQDLRQRGATGAEERKELFVVLRRADEIVRRD